MTLCKEWRTLKFFKSEEWKKLKNIEGIPAPNLRLRALEECSYDETRVVILGQDPYPNGDHACGLAFSVYPHISKLPGSLNNILYEYRSDLGYDHPRSGDLSDWVHRGILLLNTSLTVERGRPGSHRDLGWSRLAYEVLKRLNEKATPVVFILWGKEAQQYKAAIDAPQHLVLTSPHPSPLSARLGFFGSKPFSKACSHLGVDKTLWKLT